MPGKVGVKIKAGRNLPVMDRGSDTTDAYVEIKLGTVTHKTDVCRKSLNPQWNTDWFRFEVDDAELQDEPLQIRLMDYDTYSANDAIGKVNISLNPLCLDTSGQTTQGKGTVLSGWIPVFDTMHGIRGEVNVIVKVDLFSDLNKFRQSSCGIQFFHSQCIPHGYRAQVIHGFVEELVVNDDPEYQWIDKIRTPRASNEARQVVFLKLSGQVQRKMGLKAINMGANAVVGYTQCFDLEGDVGVVARGIGTAITLIKDTNSQPIANDNTLIEERTQKYLEFLNGNRISEPDWPEYKLQLRKSHSSTLFELTRDMADLIRQEDERGGEKPLKKLKNSMRQFRYSRNIFNEKCNNLMRKIGRNAKAEKSRGSIVKSLENLFSSKLFFKDHSISNNSLTQVECDTPSCSSSFWNFSRAVMRSISDDSAAMKCSKKEITNLYAIPSSLARIGEYQYSTQSSPNIAIDKSSSHVLGTTYQGLNKPNTKLKNNNTLQSSSSVYTSLSGVFRVGKNNNKPELSESMNLAPRNFSQVENSTTDATLLKPPESRRNMQSLPCISENEVNISFLTKSKLAKASEWSGFSTKKKFYIRQSTSLTNLKTNDILSETNYVVTNDFEHLKKSLEPLELEPHCPLLKICPSTPTKRKYSTNFVFDASIAAEICKSGYFNSGQLPISSLHRSSSQALLSPLDHRVDKILTNTSKSSLLAPSISLSRIKHHRSLHEIDSTARTGAVMSGGGGGTTVDSASSKHFTSPPASVCSAVTAVTPGLSVVNRAKLSLSPSKTGMPLGSTQCENSTPSTAASTKEMPEICRRSSDSDLSVTPRGNSFCVASERLVAATALMRLNQPALVGTKTASATDSAMDMLEYPFLTMTIYPPGFILHLGATVAARSVKLLERVPNPDEPEVRDSWWTELRMEIRSHARALGCNVVLGYSESTTISDDVCVLSATGTAAVINMTYNHSLSQTDIFTKNSGAVVMSGSLEERDRDRGIGDISAVAKEGSWPYGTGNAASKKYGLPAANILKNSCAICHIPYNLASVPFNVKMKKCAICRKGRVPDVLLATLEVPEYMQVTGRGCFLQAQVVRSKKDLRSELDAKEISDGLPFLEYELHRVLINKLKAKGMNAIFGLKAQVAIGERMIALIATGTALFATALPVPQVPKIVAGNSWTDKQKLNELQKKLQETFERNQEVYQLKCIDPDVVVNSGGGVSDKQSDTDESDEEVIEVDLNCGNKDTCVLEVDDIEDLEIISLMMESYPPEGFHVVNTQMVPGMLDMEAVKNLQMFTQVWRAKLDVGQNVSGFPKHFQRLLQTIYFKLRMMIPCAICDLRFRLDLPESDQIQLLVTGMALGLGEASNKIRHRRKTVPSGASSSSNSEGVNSTTVVNVVSDTNGSHGHKRTLQDEDYIFPLDEDQMTETPLPTTGFPSYGSHSLKLRKTSPSRSSSAVTTKSNNPPSFRNRYFPLRDRYGIDITPLSFIPGGKIEKYLGNLNFFFIRESTSIRENGGISGFVHGFITELLAVVRAHIAALGGNAMVSFYMTELILVDNQHKNQGQCLISIGGDAVYVSYFTDD